MDVASFIYLFFFCLVYIKGCYAESMTDQQSRLREVNFFKNVTSRKPEHAKENRKDASENCNYGVRINVLCPAFVDTQLLLSVECEETMGKFVRYKDDIKQKMDLFGVLKPSLIAEGMMRLITDDSLNGAVMKITCSKGIHFHEYEPLSA